MKRWLMVGCLVGSLGTARAQAPGAAEPVASFLEHRVPEELAAEGVMLSRHGVTLHIDQVGDVLILSLVDLSTSRVVASTKVDAVPADREAAVAMTTHVVADLMTQIAAPAATPPPAPPPVVAPDNHERELAELKFKRDSIRFNDENNISISQYGAFTHHEWFPVQGDLDRHLSPQEFYRSVGRPDLADSYDHRRNLWIGATVVGGVGLTMTVAAMLSMHPTLHNDSCVAGDPSFDTCEDAAVQRFDDQEHRMMLVTGGLLAVSTVAAVVAVWYRFHPHPISEDEAKTLADRHNQTLRRQLGLPVVASEPRVRDLQLAPVASASAAGFALGGRF